MKLSIITVNLNNRDGIQKTIDSVVSQTFKDFEWIVIDGGSTDGSKELIEKYADHFAYWVSEPDKGIYNAMNKGIKVAKGDYLQFLNSGDWFYNSNVLELVFKEQHTEDILYGDAEFLCESEKMIIRYPDTLNNTFMLGDTLCHQATFIKCRLQRNNLYNEKYTICADYDFFLREIIIKEISYRHLDLIVCSYDTTGISHNTLLTEGEREKIKDEYLGKRKYKIIRFFSRCKKMTASLFSS